MNIYYSGVLNRYFHSFSALCRKNHYDALGITPKATQGEIKSAYYKLSMLYHPDKNKGCEKANEKFKDITAAYEVLGSYSSRRKYDRGLSGGNFINVEPKRAEDVKDFKPKGSRIQTSRANFTGRTPIYDFDEWSRAHYGQMLERKAKAKAMHNNERRKAAVENENAVASLLIVFTLMLIYFYSYNNSLDEPERKSK